MAAADPGAILAGGADRGGRRGAARSGHRAPVVPLSLRPRGAVPDAVYLRAGPDPRRRREIAVGHPTALGVAPAGAGRRLRAFRYDGASLQPFHHAVRAADRARRLADADAQ